MSIIYWPSALKTTVYSLNYMPSKVLNRDSLYEVLFKKKPEYEFMKPFDSQCFPCIRAYNKINLSLVH